MAICGECAQFFKIPETDLDFEEGKGDCVRERRDQKGYFCLSRPRFENDPGCDEMKPRH